MEKSLHDLLADMNTVKISNARYYKWLDFYDVLNRNIEAKILSDDYIITPFYIRNQKVLELYYYELNIRQVDAPGRDNFILEKTAKKSIKDVPPSILQNFTRCYLEVINPCKFMSARDLHSYFGYVKDSNDLKEELINYLHEFDDEKLYFEVY